jgi:hypothetical protein
MKSMLSGLDLSTKGFGPMAYEKSLRAALEAALSLALAQNVYITCVPEHEADEAMAELNHRQALLETALEPFKVAGDDAKEPTK